MSLPFATTTLTIERQVRTDNELDIDSEADLTVDVAPWTTILSNLRAVVDGGSGDARYGVGGVETIVNYRFQADVPPITLEPGDRVTDSNGVVYTLNWARTNRGLGLYYLEGDLRQVVGEDT